jgi:hypothetical protein
MPTLTPTVPTRYLYTSTPLYAFHTHLLPRLNNCPDSTEQTHRSISHYPTRLHFEP